MNGHARIVTAGIDIASAGIVVAAWLHYLPDIAAGTVIIANLYRFYRWLRSRKRSIKFGD